MRASPLAASTQIRWDGATPHPGYAMVRFLSFMRLVLVLTALMFVIGWLSALMLPEGVLRPYFSRLFSLRVEQFTFERVLLANLLPFFGIQYMNLFSVGKYAGGLYVLPVFWILYGLLLGTNSFVFADQPVAFSINVLWTRTGFTELLAYTMSYEATKGWALWEQQGFWKVRRFPGRRWKPQVEDWVYWTAALLFLGIAVAREVY